MQIPSFGQMFLGDLKEMNGFNGSYWNISYFTTYHRYKVVLLKLLLLRP